MWYWRTFEVMCANICAIRRLLNSKQQQQQQISAKHTNKTNCKPPSSANQAQSFEVIIFFSLFRFSPFLPYNYYGGENYLQTIDLLACCLPCCAVFFASFRLLKFVVVATKSDDVVVVVCMSSPSAIKRSPILLRFYIFGNKWQKQMKKGP